MYRPDFLVVALHPVIKRGLDATGDVFYEQSGLIPDPADKGDLFAVGGRRWPNGAAGTADIRFDPACIAIEPADLVNFAVAVLVVFEDFPWRDIQREIQITPVGRKCRLINVFLVVQLFDHP